MRFIVWRFLCLWYHFACRGERAIGIRFGWTFHRTYHRVAVYWPLLLSFKVWPWHMRGNVP
jgi:hypothetical protein